MTDGFPLLGPELDNPPGFDEAVRAALARLQEAVTRFEALQTQVPETAYTDMEWRVVESAAADVEEAVERAEEGYVAAQFDSHAWYRIMQSLERVYLRLESAIGIMELARDRVASG